MNPGRIIEPRASKVLNAAATQWDRMRQGPRPAELRVDGRSQAQLLSFGARYGKLIQFYDLADQALGDWSAFYLSDPAVADALHAALDLRRIEGELHRLIARARVEPPDLQAHGPLPRALDIVVRLLSILDRSAPAGPEVEAQLQLQLGVERHGILALPSRRLHAHWTDAIEGEGRRVWLRRDLERFDAPWRERLLDLMEELAVHLFEELLHGAQAARQAAEASLRSHGHAPQAAVYNAFTVLFAEARTELNHFPRRLLDFYYGSILEQTSRACEPESVYMAFTLAQGIDEASVAKGTLFSAGVDAQGQAIDYAADTSLAVTPASIAAMSVSRVTYADHGAIALQTGVLTGVVDPQSTEAFPIFGSNQPGEQGALTMQPASIGFVVASPVLQCTGGSRRFSITLSASSASSAAQDAEAAAAPTSTGAEPVGSQDFEMYYSTAGGWVSVAALDVTPSAVGSDGAMTQLVFSFSLPAGAPPLVPLSTPPAEDAAAPSLPADAFEYTGEAPAVVAQWVQQASGNGGQYGVLALIEVATVTVNVSVAGLPPAALLTPDGPVDTDHNFALFGNAPAQYGAVEIDAPELFVKTLSSLTLNVDWAGLPINSTGFQGYYKGYVLDADGNVSAQPLFDNTSFRVAFSVVSPGLWNLDVNTQNYLFQTDSASATPAADAPLQPLSKLQATLASPAPAPPYYAAASSRLRLSLVEPSYAFGDMLYLSNLMAASRASSSTAAQQAKAPAPAPSTSASATAQVASATTTNATASDGSYRQKVGSAVRQAQAALNGKALAALQAAVAGSGAEAGTQAAWLKELKAAAQGALGQGKAGTLAAQLKALFGQVDGSQVAAQLKAWVAAHKGQLQAQGSAALNQAHSMLSASQGLSTALASIRSQPAELARPTTAQALQQAQGATSQADAQAAQVSSATASTVLPNTPWMPAASAITIDYTATAVVGAATLVETPGQGASATSADGAVQPPADGRPTPPPPADTTPKVAASSPSAHQFLHLHPFRQVAPPDRQAGARVRLVPEVAPQAALIIQLSAPVSQVSLLFVLQAGPEGWSTEQPQIAWEQNSTQGWQAVQVLGDSTNGLMNSGVVSLQLLGGASLDASTCNPQLRLRLLNHVSHAPYVASVCTNALRATWVGPGGADQLGQPLPAGTIQQSETTITGIGSITQPMESFGGHPPATGRKFDAWMSERLRHKGYAINAWDHAHIAMAAVPTLWQAAVVPATDGSTGRAAPGQVWVVAVAGPQTPNVADATVPLVSPQVLAEIGELLRQRFGPFVELQVTNPPYRRLTIEADLVFNDLDTVDHWTQQLQADLVAWLSPWPPTHLGPRPAEYYTRQHVAAFIRSRDYVLGITRLHLTPEPVETDLGWTYLTSSLQHQLTGSSQPATQAVHGPARHLRAGHVMAAAGHAT